jgi:hypothetical protein
MAPQPPVPTPPPTPPPRPGGPSPSSPPPGPRTPLAIRARRQRTIRVLSQLGRYAIGWGLVGWACWWLGDVHMFLPGLAFAAMVCNPWRLRRPARPARAGSGMRVSTSGLTRAGLALAGSPSGVAARFGADRST